MGTTAEVIDQWLELEAQFANPPQIRLELYSQVPPGQTSVDLIDIAASTAIQCYSPGRAFIKERDAKAREIAASTRETGHLTTRQHACATFHFGGITRRIIQTVLHAHPFYNSEQQSQRYVPAKDDSFLIPANLTESQRSLYLQAAHYSFAQYQRIVELLSEPIRKRLLDSLPSRWQSDEKRIAASTLKKSQELARYVLPVGQTSVMHHTLSELSLLRLVRAGNLPHITDEGRFAIASMVKSWGNQDPSIYDELPTTLEMNANPQYNLDEIRQSNKEFDDRLSGHRSILALGDTMGLRDLTANSVRNILGKSSVSLSEEQAIAAFLDPRQNLLLTDIWDTGIHDPLTAIGLTIPISFYTRLSHSADSQRQRHRMTPGNTPPLISTFSGEADFVTPMVVEQTPHVNSEYLATMEQMYINVGKLISSGVSLEHALLMLPNAHALRIIESGPLLGWIHRWKQRLCHLAQEEISQVSFDQANALQKIFPEGKNLFHAPCAVRAQARVTPFCPEGDRFCGIPVWRIPLEEYWERRQY